MTPENAKARARLHAARGRAIESYADLEQALCRLFSNLLETKPDLAGIVFFRIINTRSRNRILEDLMKKRVEPDYSAYRNSLLRFIGNIDQERNEIVHWASVAVVAAPPKATYTLMPPNVWGLSPTSPKKTKDDLREFSRRCGFAARSVNVFSALVVQKIHTWNARDTLLQTFREELIYPPPDTHPLSPNYKAP